MELKGAREIMQTLSFRDHIRSRPDMYLGLMSHQVGLCWLTGWPHDVNVPPRIVSDVCDKKELDRLRRQEIIPEAETRTEMGTEIETDSKTEMDPDPETEMEMEMGTGTGTGITALSPVVSRRVIEYSPAAVKAVNEVFQNMGDRPLKDDLMRRMDVTIDAAAGRIVCRNDGYGMLVSKPDPVVNPSAPDEYWPTICFSEGMSGGNFEEVEGMEHHQGGRNGIGAKATNICSRRFKVTVGDPVNKKWFQQEWTDGMRVASVPVVKAYKLKVGFVEVDFDLDTEFFGYGPDVGFTPEFAALLRTHVWQLAAVTPDHVATYLDGVRLPVKNLLQYTRLFYGASPSSSPSSASTVKSLQPARSTLLNGKGTVVFDVAVLPTAGTGMPSDVLAFVNGIPCHAGRHVQFLFTKLAAILEGPVQKRTHLKDSSLTSADVKKAVFAVLSLRIHLPRWGGQSKEVLDSVPTTWGFKWEPDDAFCKRVVTLLAEPVADQLLTKTEASDVKTAAKKNSGSGGRKAVNMVKYEPAGTAGARNTHAMLLLLEGDSAKNMAMAGRAVVGSDVLGVYPLKGKPLNPRNLPPSRARKNETLNSIAVILNLQYGKAYDTEAETAELNYRHLVLLADQDVDGGHIVGLLVNWLEHFWPALLVTWPDFVKRFATPIQVKIPRAPYAGSLPDVRFLSKAAAKAWDAEDPLRAAKYTTTYYKGLGGHSDGAARDFFAAMSDFVVSLTYDGLDGEDHAALVSFFDKGQAAARRDMLLHAYDEDSFVDYDQAAVPIRTYLQFETLHYSADHLVRNIPGPDGLKRTQRKIVFHLLSRRSRATEKVTVLASKAIAATHYHHGEKSMYSTLVGLAQAHTGANNVNLFKNSGQFGGRNEPRDVYSDPRYLSTALEPITEKLFRPEDAPILTYDVEDGQYVVEPVFGAAVVPVDLLNGCSGVATGWRTEIPAFHPGQVIHAVKARVREDPDWPATANAMLPWYDGFTGVVDAVGTSSWRTFGLYHIEESEEDDVVRVVISDLPVGRWTDPYYADVLHPLLVNYRNDKGDPTPEAFILRILSDTTNTRIRYTLVCDKAAFARARGTETAEPFAPDPRGFLNSADESVLRQASEVYARRQVRYLNLERLLKLENATTWKQMHRFDAAGRIVHYPDMAALLDGFYHFRLPLYQARLQSQLSELMRSQCLLQEKIRYLKEVIAGTIVVQAYKTVAALCADLVTKGYIPDGDARITKPPVKTTADDQDLVLNSGNVSDNDGGDDGDSDDGDDPDTTTSPTTKAPTFKYLTGLSIVRLTASEMRALETKLQHVTATIDAQRSRTPTEAWLQDLDELAAAYTDFQAARVAANHIANAFKNKAVTKRRRGVSRKLVLAHT